PAATPTPLPLPTVAGTTGNTLPAPELGNVGWLDRNPFAANLITSEQAVLAELAGATVYHMDIEIDASLTELRGREEFLYTNRDDVPLAELYLRLFPNLSGGASTTSNV